MPRVDVTPEILERLEELEVRGTSIKRQNKILREEFNIGPAQATALRRQMLRSWAKEHRTRSRLRVLRHRHTLDHLLDQSIEEGKLSVALRTVQTAIRLDGIMHNPGEVDDDPPAPPPAAKEGGGAPAVVVTQVNIPSTAPPHELAAELEALEEKRKRWNKITGDTRPAATAPPTKARK